MKGRGGEMLNPSEFALYAHLQPTPSTQFFTYSFKSLWGTLSVTATAWWELVLFLAAFVIPLSTSVSPCHHLLQLVGRQCLSASPIGVSVSFKSVPFNITACTHITLLITF